MSTGKATSKSGRTFSVGSKRCGEPLAAAGFAGVAASLAAGAVGVFAAGAGVGDPDGAPAGAGDVAGAVVAGGGC